MLDGFTEKQIAVAIFAAPFLLLCSVWMAAAALGLVEATPPTNGDK